MTDGQAGSGALGGGHNGSVPLEDDQRRRRGGWLWLLAGVAGLVIAGIVIALVAEGNSPHHPSAAARSAQPAATGTAAVPSSATPATGTSATPSAAAATTPASAAGSSSTTSTGTQLPRHGFVGGGGVAVEPATRQLVAAGAVGIVLFTEDGAALDTDARMVTSAAVQEIDRQHDRAVTVIGFTDGIGNARLNRTLSLDRARTVAAVLRSGVSVPGTEITVQARGKSRPVASNGTSQGRQLNRRVLILAR